MTSRADAPRGSLTVWLQPTDAPKRDKNRNHPDLHVPDGGDVDAEAKRPSHGRPGGETFLGFNGRHRRGASSRTRCGDVVGAVLRRP
ncbi:hypothetical protein [Nonomuraea roseola]|uniref:Uncharacterized protein n=1 Tax=Nonomuraea roseola TaxID=46179 RepID=A0ABV5QBP9_9ACTN